MRATLTLTGEVVDDPGDSLPRWFAFKTIPDVESPRDAIHQLALTGPSAFRRGPSYAATAEIEVSQQANDELGWLTPRKILGAELWSEVDLTLGYGRVLSDLRVSGDVG